MDVRCVNKKCFHKWDYQGQSNNYISCPICHFKFKIQRAINMLNTSFNIPNNIPTDIPSNILSRRVFINRVTPGMFNLNDDEELDEEEFEEQEELFPIQITKLCKEHDLPARYDDYEKEWICGECIESEIEKNIGTKKIKEMTSHLGFIREIVSDIEIDQLSYPLPINKGTIFAN